MIEDVLLAVALCVPLAIAAIASFIAPRRIRWVVRAGVLLAAGLLVLGLFVWTRDNYDWGTSGGVVFSLLVAAVALLLWMIGSALGWAAGRAAGRDRQRVQHP